MRLNSNLKVRYGLFILFLSMFSKGAEERNLYPSAVRRLCHKFYQLAILRAPEWKTLLDTIASNPIKGRDPIWEAIEKLAETEPLESQGVIKTLLSPKYFQKLETGGFISKPGLAREEFGPLTTSLLKIDPEGRYLLPAIEKAIKSFETDPQPASIEYAYGNYITKIMVRLSYESEALKKKLTPLLENEKVKRVLRTNTLLEKEEIDALRITVAW